MIRLSISEHLECPKMDSLFNAVADYQRVMSLVWKLCKIRAKRNSSK